MKAKRHFRNVIEFQGPSDSLIWLHPVEDYFAGSILIVEPGMSAVFVNKGELAHVFSPGRHVLTTENYPFLTALQTLISGGVTSYRCSVLFVSTVPGPEFLYGTASPLQLRDKARHILVDATVHGALRMRVTDSARLISTLCGCQIWSWKALFDRLRITLNGRIRTIFGILFNDFGSELIGLNYHLEEFSEEAEQALSAKLQEQYGLEVVSFEIEGFTLDEEKYHRLDDAVISRFCKEETAAADRTVMEMQKNRWSEQQYYDLMRAYAANPNARLFTFQGLRETPPEGQKPTAGLPDRLRALRSLLDEGLITEKEYELQKLQLLTEL